MLSSASRFALLFTAAVSGAWDAQALIIYGTGPTDVNNALNTTAPTTGTFSYVSQFLWPYVANFGNASAVYLGNGYLLTANHVAPVPDSGIVINNVSYNRDLTYNPLQVVEGADVPDMKLVKIVNPPALATLPIHFSTGDTTSCTLVGWGVGKGAIIAGQGWSWGSDPVRTQRWGTNSAVAASSASTGLPFDGLRTLFNAGSTNEAQITIGDSGSGLFSNIGGVWKLTGLATNVSTANAALYNPVDSSYFIRLKTYAHLLRYENWANLKLGSSTASMTADADGDGSSNLLEYAFYTTPTSAASSSRPQVGIEGGFLTLTYTQLMSATDLSYVVQESTDLTNPNGWIPATVIEEIVSTSGVTRVVKAKVAINSAPQKFLRLSVTKVP